jgi:large subunit ribosomal protein L5e
MRYQTKFRRRREGKTDYYARRRLVFQDKDKYDTRKYRFVVRRTNQRIICQVIHATLQGDRVMVNADSKELSAHGLKAGPTNYAAAYCVGLLAARRLLTSLKLADKYTGNSKCDGDAYNVTPITNSPRPFKAFLDVGLVRTTTGNRVFGALKGACDGGLNIPHKTKRFPGTRVTKAEAVTNKRGKAVDVEKAKTSFDANEHREHIFGIHVQEYYDMLKDKPDAFRRQFSRWTKALNGKSFEEYYTAIHASIRKSPARANAKKARTKPQAASSELGFSTFATKGAKNASGKPARNGGKWIAFKRLTHAERAARVEAKILAITKEVMA